MAGLCADILAERYGLQVPCAPDSFFFVVVASSELFFLTRSSLLLYHQRLNDAVYKRFFHLHVARSSLGGIRHVCTTVGITRSENVVNTTIIFARLCSRLLIQRLYIQHWV